MTERRAAERRVGLKRLFARAKQVLTTDPKGSDEDDLVVDEEAARALAAEAGRLKGGLAKVAQLAAYDPGAMLGRTRGATVAARRALGTLWDHAPGVAAGAIARVIEEDLGKSPQQLFEAWDPVPIAAASLGQVHAAKLRDGTDVVVKVQYPDIAASLRADLDDPDFVRRLAGAELGHSLDAAGLATLAEAVRRELDYRAEAAAQARFAAAWASSPALGVPRAIDELTSERVLTQTRARGKTVVEVAASGTPEVRRAAAAAIFAFAWGSPLAHGLLNADPNPGNFLVDVEPDGHVRVWALDFGCALELPAEVRDFDREMYWALLDDDAQRAAERFRMALSHSGILRRADSLASLAHRDWERALATPLATHGDFHWSATYASTLADATSRVLAAGGLGLPASFVLLWRQRLGAAAVVGMLDAHAPFRRVLVELVGIGRKALR
jgi:predicted unusual protein kinase regulating ubiquinone biosynthesis (AarF/ABC1/UbiB family)